MREYRIKKKKKKKKTPKNQKGKVSGKINLSP